MYLQQHSLSYRFDTSSVPFIPFQNYVDFQQYVATVIALSMAAFRYFRAGIGASVAWTALKPRRHIGEDQHP